MVAQSVGVEAHGVHQLDGRGIAKEIRDRRRGADRVARGDGDGAVLALRPVDIEPRLQEGGTADGEARANGVGRLREGHQLPVKVADVEDGVDLQRRLGREIHEDLAARVLRAVDPEQEGERWGDVDRPDAGHGILLADPRA